MKRRSAPFLPGQLVQSTFPLTGGAPRTWTVRAVTKDARSGSGWRVAVQREADEQIGRDHPALFEGGIDSGWFEEMNLFERAK